MAVLHDLAESVIGDLPLPAQRFFPPGVKHAAEEAALADLLAPLPGGAQLVALWREYESRSVPEARLVREADRLETLLQAYVYEWRTGNRSLSEFWDTPSEPRAFGICVEPRA
jgi:putative hydrolase of HD superfamily